MKCFKLLIGPQPCCIDFNNRRKLNKHRKSFFSTDVETTDDILLYLLERLHFFL